MATYWSKPIAVNITIPSVFTSASAVTVTLIGVLYCNRCKRRQRYVDCSKCSRPLCALCSWTVRLPPLGMNGLIDERCRECVDL